MSSTHAEQFDSHGFVPGVFRGARSFRITEGGFLTGVVYQQVWLPGENIAECRNTPMSYVSYYASASFLDQPVVLPAGHGMDICRHGFYGYSDNSNDYHAHGYVSGVIEGYGKQVMTGSRGFRADKARIVALCVSEVRLVERDRVALVSVNYPNIPMFNTFEQMVAEYPPDAGEDD